MRPDTFVDRRTVLKGTAAAIVGAGLANPAAARPDKGAQASGKFQLDGTAEIVREPDVRPTNFVVRTDTRSEAFDPENGLYGGSLGRSLEVSQLSDLEGKLSLDVKVVEGHTILSAPRISLFVDTGEGDPVAIHGYDLELGPGAQGPGIDSDDGWVSAEFSGSGTKWNDSAIGGGTFDDWSTVLSNWSDDYSIVEGWAIDDGYWADGAGVLHLDNVQIGNSTLEGPSDVVGN